VDEHGDITRAPKEMLDLLRDAAQSEGLDPDGRDNDFPGGASVLSKRLVPVVPTLEALRIKVEDGRENSKARKRFIRFSRDGQEPDSYGQLTDSSSPDESGVPIAKRTGRTGRTGLFSENSKGTEERMDNGHDDAVLQGGKNAVRTVRKRRRRRKSPQLSQPESDSSNGKAVRKAVRNDGDAVRNEGDADPLADEERMARFKEVGRQDVGEYLKALEDEAPAGTMKWQEDGVEWVYTPVEFEVDGITVEYYGTLAEDDYKKDE
jgi:hypothetical protein